MITRFKIVKNIYFQTFVYIVHHQCKTHASGIHLGLIMSQQWSMMKSLVIMILHDNRYQALLDVTIPCGQTLCLIN